MNYMSAEYGEAGIYIVDQDYRIVYLNDMAKTYYPDLLTGMYCYQGMGKNSAPCLDCPCSTGKCGKAIIYHADLRMWMEVSSGNIDWLGQKNCRLMMFRPVDETNKNVFYNLTENTVYDELFELNLSANTYKILFYKKDKFKIPFIEGDLSTMFMETANLMVHPDDREKFLKFFHLPSFVDRLYANGKIVKEVFRKRLIDGTYCWVDMAAVLFRYGDSTDTLVMCYIQDIDRNKKKEVEEETKKREKWEEMDSMTGLFRYGPFFEKAEHLLKQRVGTKYFLVAIDFEHFKLFNEWYGEEEGDRFLSRIGDYLKNLELRYDCLAGYMGGDDFVIILPADLAVLTEMENRIQSYAKAYGGNAGFLPALGVYKIEDEVVPVSMMYDRASIALNLVKGNYSKRIGWYDPGMKQKMENDQVLLSDIQRGLEMKEFIFYLQPQCNMLTGKIIGLESLVRWQHPTKGIVSPKDFIPLLERNGFITYLDIYIWEMVCKELSKWVKSGRRPIPISVNMSRMDIYAIDVVEKFKQLVKQYDIAPKYLEIEITESAYAEDYDLIRNVVEELRKAGFPVFMDDFGSGYSSLNMLKDVNVDVIKIDTKFLEMDETSQSRGKGILETIVRMAKVMQLKVIAEGVEKKEHVDFLLNIGCIYGQGFYYHRPIPVSEANGLLKEERNVDFRGIQARQLKQLKLEDLFNENITSEAVLNNMVGAIALYEVYEDNFTVLRVNEEYYRVTGENPVDMEEHRGFMINKIYRDDIDRVLTIFEHALLNPIHGAEGIFRRYRLNGELMWVHFRVFFLREQNGRRLYYGTVRDATEQMEQRKQLDESQKMLEDVLTLAGKNISFDNIAEENQWTAGAIFSQMAPGGLIGIYCEKGFPLYFANNEMLRLLDYDSYEMFYKEIGGNLLPLFHKDDLRLIEGTLSSLVPGMEYSFRHRIKKRDGSWLWLMTKGRIVKAETGRLAIVSACMDITDTVLAQKKLQATNRILRFKNDELEFLSSGMQGGYFRCKNSNQMELIYISPRFLEILGYTEDEIREQFSGQFVAMLDPADRVNIIDRLNSLKSEEILKGVKYRILSKQGFIWILCHIKLSVREGKDSLYGVISDIDENIKLQEQLKENGAKTDTKNSINKEKE